MPPPYNALPPARHHTALPPARHIATTTPYGQPERNLQRNQKRNLQRNLQRPTTPLSQITAIIIAIRIHVLLYKTRRSPLPPPKALSPQTIHATIHTAASLPRGHALVSHTLLSEPQPTNPTRRSP